jgi:hypothetical protein
MRPASPASAGGLHGLLFKEKGVSLVERAEKAAVSAVSELDA